MQSNRSLTPVGQRLSEPGPHDPTLGVQPAQSLAARVGLVDVDVRPDLRAAPSLTQLVGTARRVLLRAQDQITSMALVLAALVLYAATLLPGVGSRDTAEFQWVAPTLGLAHPTGYPLYTLLGWLWSHLPLGGTPAWRMNLFSALSAALAVGVFYLTCRELGQRRSVAGAAALALATSLSYWSQATIAEVYGLAALLQILLFRALLRWRSGRQAFWNVGLLLGLSLAHHRTILLLIPGVLLFIVFSRRPTRAELGAALAALLAACMLYLYLPLRAAWADPWGMFWQHVLGAEMASGWFDIAKLRADGLGRVVDLAQRFVVSQFLPAGTLLGALGALRLCRRDWGLAALLLVGYVLILAFCAAYYVGDIEVFLIPAHLIAALLVGEGAMLAARMTSRRMRPAVGALLLLLPVVLFNQNLSAIRMANSNEAELRVRDILAQPIAPKALLVSDWSVSEGLRYLQQVEGVREDLELSSQMNPKHILDTLKAGRPVYVLNPEPALGLAQWPEGRLWRVGKQLLEPKVASAFTWEEGITLAGYTLPTNPCAAGQAVPVTLAWEAHQRPTRPYTLFVHIVAEDGTIWGQQDRAPSGASTEHWNPGDRMVDLYTPVLRPDTPPGRYQVTLGWYEFPSLQRLSLAADQGAPVLDYITLGEITVAAVER